MLLSLLIAIPLGIAQAVKRNSIGDYAVTALNFILYSMPSFFLGLILIQFFALDWHIFPPTVSRLGHDRLAGVHASGAADPADRHAGRDQRRLASAATCAPRRSTTSRRTTSGSRAPRASRSALVLFRHLLRNACLPMITLVGLSIPTLLAGNLLIETLFNYPGLGLLFFNALGTSTTTVLLAYTSSAAS